MFCLIFLLGHIVLVTELTARPSTLLCALRKGDNECLIHYEHKYII
jgi:hypothetical protein